jgi:hypothetical protein
MQGPVDDSELETLGLPGARPGEDASDFLQPGMRVGRYRIEALLGHGGMGAVYRAGQIEPVRRTVALKLLRGTRLDTLQRAYFEVERQMLAQMQHPAIAQIFDAGTTGTGAPYFAMEYIEGLPIAGYCERHGLALDARIALFAQVCDGVQHAHSRGIVHRDLKPDNILVTEVDGRAMPKIIDFGIATAATRLFADGTGGAEIAGTPTYMSPEQSGFSQFLVDARSDVYSLGVILFELLTGARPAAGSRLRSVAADGTEHTTLRAPSQALEEAGGRHLADVARARGLRPGRLRALLRAELDFVVAKAVRHDPAERYASAGELAEELRRYLAQRPLIAVGDRPGYAAGKFLRRHRVAFAAASAVLAAIVLGLVFSLYGLMQARTQRAVAEARQSELEQVAAFQQSMLAGIDVEAMGKAMLDRQRAQVAQSGDAALAGAFERVSGVLNGADVARDVLDRQLLARARAAVARDFADQPALAADLDSAVADVYEAIGLFAQSEDAARSAWTLRRAQFGEADRRTWAAAAELGRALNRQGKQDEALSLLQAVWDVAGATPPGPNERLGVGIELAQVHSDRGELAAARALQQRLLDESAHMDGVDPDRVLTLRNNLGITLARLGEGAAALAEFEQVYEARRRVNPESEGTLSTMTNLSAARAMNGDFEGALALQRASYAIRLRTAGAEHPATLNDISNIASSLVDLGRFDEARPLLEQVIDARRRVLGPEHFQTLRSTQNLAALLDRSGHGADAVDLQRQVLEARRRTLGAEHPDTLKSEDVYCSILKNIGRLDEARSCAAGVYAARQRLLGNGHPDTLRSAALLAEVERLDGDAAAAIGVLDPLLTELRAARGDADPEVVFLAARLYGLRRSEGDLAAAGPLRQAFLDPLLARDAAGLPASLRRARKAAEEAVQDAPTIRGSGSSTTPKR